MQDVNPSCKPMTPWEARTQRETGVKSLTKIHAGIPQNFRNPQVYGTISSYRMKVKVSMWAGNSSLILQICLPENRVGAGAWE